MNSTNLLLRFALLLMISCCIGVRAEESKLVSRLESDRNFVIPHHRTEQIWGNIRKKFKKGFTFNDLTLRGVVSIEQFSDEYFDNRDLSLVQQWVSLRHRRRVGELGAKKELIQVKITPKDGAAFDMQARNERKFEVSESYSEHAPFVMRIKNKDRQRFIETMQELGVDPASLVPVMQIRQERRRVYFRRDDAQFFTVTVDIAQGSRWPFNPRMAQVEFEISEKAMTNALDKERLLLVALQKSIIEAAGVEAQGLTEDTRPKIVHMFDEIFSRPYGPVARWYILNPWSLPLACALGCLIVIVILSRMFGIRRTFYS